MKSIEKRAAEALAFARQVAEKAESWMDASNALFGPGGKIVELFPNREDRTALMRLSDYKAITDLIDGLREAKGDPAPIADLVGRANGHMNIRLPRSVHAALLAEADAEGVSLNQLCLAKLCVQLRVAVG